jgi:hypothetical protein
LSTLVGASVMSPELHAASAAANETEVKARQWVISCS